jgi:hypothetical protein
MRTTCPCKDCVYPERHYACHDTCAKYWDWCRERAIAKELERVGHDADSHRVDTVLRKKSKARCKSGKVWGRK